MDETPRFHFFSLTFLIGFGVGAFIGVALGLTAFLFVDTSQEQATTQADADATPLVTTSPGVVPTPVRVRTNTALEVRIGPGTQFAAVGTIGRGESVDVVGRDDLAEWVAIRFPPGSSARGWLPVRALENLTNLYGLTVAIATPLPRSVATPTAASGVISSNDGPLSTPVFAATAAPGTTPLATATAVSVGQPDLTVTGVSRLADGRVRVVITNRGSGDLTGFTVFAVVTDPTTRSETLRSNGAGLRAGDSTSLESTTFTVTEPTTVTAVVDPSSSSPDASRGNNAMTVQLAPPAGPTPTPQN